MLSLSPVIVDTVEDGSDSNSGAVADTVEDGSDGVSGVVDEFASIPLPSALVGITGEGEDQGEWNVDAVEPFV